MTRPCDVAVENNQSVHCRHHAEFRRENGECQVVDLGSLNGTYLNRKPLLTLACWLTATRSRSASSVWCSDQAHDGLTPDRKYHLVSRAFRPRVKLPVLVAAAIRAVTFNEPIHQGVMARSA